MPRTSLCLLIGLLIVPPAAFAVGFNLGQQTPPPREVTTTNDPHEVMPAAADFFLFIPSDLERYPGPHLAWQEFPAAVEFLEQGYSVVLIREAGGKWRMGQARRAEPWE